MKAAYVDTSYLVAITFAESGSARLVKSLDSYDDLLSSNLLEAELRLALHREKVMADPSDMLAGLSWVYPDRPLTKEIARVLAVDYVRGADLWHLAVALFIDPSCEVDFLSLDNRQREISRRLGFGGN
ncbi:MAG TPA: PIN domain-containing protein [Thermoanaerobaculia bacterium]|nr:PIN domain-containing protein [Thermoanaerobaculia bacterium]